MAEAMANAKAAGQLQGQRDVIFAAWSGEELGLLGSSHYVKNLETLFSQHAAAVEPEGAPGEKKPPEKEQAAAEQAAAKPSNATTAVPTRED